MGLFVGRLVGNAFVKIAELRLFVVSELGRSEEEGARRKRPTRLQNSAAWKKYWPMPGQSIGKLVNQVACQIYC